MERYSAASVAVMFWHVQNTKELSRKESLRLAVPSNQPGGLDAARSDHFGHCDMFTIVEIREGAVDSVTCVENVEHGAGGCMVPVQFLRDQGMGAIVVGGIGARPLQGFGEVGIKVYFADRNHAQSVAEAVDGMVAGRFPEIRPEQACQGHGNCH